MAVAIFIAVLWAMVFETACASYLNNASSLDTAAVACGQLHDRLGPSLIVLPSNNNYTELREENWSQTAWQHPACIALPITTADVSLLVSFLADNQVYFAIRSGGHSPFPFDANINDGVLISLDHFDAIIYDENTGLVSLGPGARWDAVYMELDKYNKTTVGGRVMNVGVGGLVLGSGLSYLTDLYGMACDNVVKYEIVLADGRIVEASSTSNHELFWGLKGGSNNFGIVTKFYAKTYPIYQVWGGIQVFSNEQVPALLQALHDYQTQPNKDPYANLIINLVPTNGSMLLTLVYLKPEERPEAYAPFYNLTPTLEQTGFMTLHELMALFPPASLPRWTWHVHSFKPNSELYNELATLYATAPEIATIGALEAGSLIAAVQPVSASAVKAGQGSNNGTGNALGLDAISQVWWTVTVAWWNPQDDAAAYAAGASFADKLQAAAVAHNATVDYIFMNDANAEQSVIESYGAINVRRLREVQQAYDPDLVFQRLVPGGQKIPHV